MQYDSMGFYEHLLDRFFFVLIETLKLKVTKSH